MQTTLLGLAIAIILALVAALVAPHVVEWDRYRSVLEAKASTVIGLQVHVKGNIDARILPSPRIRLRAVEIGEKGQPPRVRAAGLDLEVGLGPLLRGEVRATEVHLVAPEVSIGLDRSGKIDWPAMSAAFRPDALSVSHLNVEDGRLILTHGASGERIVLQKLWFNGEIRSFQGPFSGEGAFVIGNELYGYRINGGRLDEDGALRIRLGIDPTNHPLTTEIDGTLSATRGIPQFEGALALTRPVGAALSDGRRVMSDPWRVAGKIRVTPASALLQDAEFQYGPDDRALKFTTTAELKFGDRLRLDGVISARQLDLDRALAAPDLTRKPPLAVIKAFADLASENLRLPIPAQIGVGFDALTLGGTKIQSLRGDLSFDDKGWSIDRFEFRAPGFSQVSLSGRLDATAQGVAFKGPANIEAADFKILVAWLEGREIPAGQARALRARGDLTVANDKFAIDRLTASLDREKVEGRLAYSWTTADRPATLDAQLSAAELDLDALIGFGDAALGGTGLELPREVALAVDVGKATLAGVDARRVKANLKLDAGILQIDRLSVGDLGGASLDVRGRIDELSSRPRGQVILDLDAGALAGLTGLVARIAPRAAEPFRRFADRLAPANVRAVLSVERAAGAGTVAKLGVDGHLGALRVSLNGDATGDPAEMNAAGMRMTAQLDAEDGRVLLALLGLDRAVAVDRKAGRMTVSLNGPLNGDLRVDGVLSTAGLDASANGKLRLAGEQTPTGGLQIRLAAADMRPLRRAMTGQMGDALPISVLANMAVAGADLSFTDLTGAIGNSSVRGRLSVGLSDPLSIGGDVEVDKVDAAALLATALGIRPGAAASANAPASTWSPDPLAAGAFSDLDGAVNFKLARASFSSALEARDLNGVARFRRGEIVLENLDGMAAGGRLAGGFVFRRGADGLAARGHIELAGADAAALLAPATKPVDGRLSAKIEADGIGLSPMALIGSLHGGGTITLTGGHIAGLDESAFEAAMQVADQGGPIQDSKIYAAVSAAMDRGHAAMTLSDAPVTIAAGQARLASVKTQSPGGADLALSGMFDLTDGSLDARLTLSGKPGANALISQQPDLLVTLRGPVAAPQRTLDVSALTGWLALRAADQQARRLEAIEASRREAANRPVVRPESPALRFTSEGTSVETLMPANVPFPHSPSARGLDRLQPELSLPLPSGADPGITGAPALSGPIDIRPAPVPAPPRANSAGATGETGVPRGPPPERSLFDFLFRPQN